MAMSQGNYLYHYLKQTKCHFIFLLQKSQNRKMQSNWGLVLVGWSRRWGKSVGRTI
jgi:hypothetical protein